MVAGDMQTGTMSGQGNVVPLSANLGFLWTDLPLPQAVRAAARAGFDAVELHWPYAVDPAALKDVLDETGLPVLALNTLRGDPTKGEFGLAAVPGRDGEARAHFDQALAYARAIGAGRIHVLAGIAEGAGARSVFIDNLRRARDLAAPHGIELLIEPLNSRDVPGYFLSDCDTAREIIAALGGQGVSIMYDLYHMQIMRGDLLTQAIRHMDRIGHIQFAANPGRGMPDRGEVDFTFLLPALRDAGYGGYFGAEYRPGADTDASLGWMDRFRVNPPAPRSPS